MIFLKTEDEIELMRAANQLVAKTLAEVGKHVKPGVTTKEDTIDRILGMNITFVTTAKTDEEGYALLKEFGLPFKNAKND